MNILALSRNRGFPRQKLSHFFRTTTLARSLSLGALRAVQFLRGINLSRMVSETDVSHWLPTSNTVPHTLSGDRNVRSRTAIVSIHTSSLALCIPAWRAP